MKPRPHWVDRIEAGWKRRSVVWFPGVRRVGKTTLCLSLPDIEYFDCELPRVRRQLEDPEAFLAELPGKRVVLDEIHRLERPAELLKIAADHHPQVRIVATGSSTLGASAKFRDTLAGRKSVVWLTPMNLADLDSFGERKLIAHQAGIWSRHKRCQSPEQVSGIEHETSGPRGVRPRPVQVVRDSTVLPQTQALLRERCATPVAADSGRELRMSR